MNQELKKALWWMAPINFDGNPVGAMVRTAETVAAGVGSILVLHTLGADCAGPIAIGTLIIMGGQFMVCRSYAGESRTDWRRKWNIKQQNLPPDVDHE